MLEDLQPFRLTRHVSGKRRRRGIGDPSRRDQPGRPFQSVGDLQDGLPRKAVRPYTHGTHERPNPGRDGRCGRRTSGHLVVPATGIHESAHGHPGRRQVSGRESGQGPMRGPCAARDEHDDRGWLVCGRFSGTSERGRECEQRQPAICDRDHSSAFRKSIRGAEARLRRTDNTARLIAREPLGRQPPGTTLTPKRRGSLCLVPQPDGHFVPVQGGCPRPGIMNSPLDGRASGARGLRGTGPSPGVYGLPLGERVGLELTSLFSGLRTSRFGGCAGRYPPDWRMRPC